MKKILFAIPALLYLVSCTNDGSVMNSGNNSSQTSPNAPVIYRDESITAANAYSDLFLDSTAINSYIEREKLDGNKAQMLQNFYVLRNNQFAWFTSTGLTEQARGLWSLYSGDKINSKNKDQDLLQKRMDSLVATDSIMISNTDTSFIQSELALTVKLIEQADTDNGIVNRSNIYNLVPRRKFGVLELTDSILNKQRDTAAYAANKSYSTMKQQLSLYYNAAKNGGWQPISAGVFKKGSSTPAVAALKKRLQATNDYPAGDTTAVYNDTLMSVVKDLQTRFGLKPTGVVNDSLIKELNVTAEERLQQIILNMNRMMWTQSNTSDSNRIDVNIASQMLYAYQGGTRAFEMRVIVGEEGTNTTVFSGRINQVVFNPIWNVPVSIVKNEILPAMKKDPNYLKKKNMEKTGGTDSLPVIKQMPGKDNALGKVKFLFPNRYDIYLHDTPDKSLFAKKDRRLSHGCIRVADAAKLAEFILSNGDDWNSEKIRSAMTGDKEQSVPVKQAVPVNLSYLTAWVDEKGKMNFTKDSYGFDKSSVARMFTGASSNISSTTPAQDTIKTKPVRP